VILETDSYAEYTYIIDEESPVLKNVLKETLSLE